MRELSTSFRVKQVLADCTVYLSGWSQSRLQPTFSANVDDGLIWVDDAKLQRFIDKHPSAEWSEITMEKEYLHEPRDIGGDRFRRLNRRSQNG